MDPAQISEEIRIANPYQYLGPLSKGEFFFDRESELQDAVVVCEQILRGVTGGVVVIGGRGSGKTSFIDALRRKLNERHIANAKIPLNSSLVTAGNEIAFFKAILSELLRATEQANLIEKGIVDKLRDFVDGIGVQVDQLGFEIPGINFIVKAGQSGSVGRIPYIMLRDELNDFVQILDNKARDETKRGAIIILDEGDNLTLNKDLLQILRNVFQDFPRIGLIVAGSTKLLAQVSEVFSPIPRFFRKIELGPYPNDSIVDEAINSPLNHVKNEFSAKGISLEVLHRGFDPLVKIISGRMPMEINLLCHFAFELAAKNLKVDNGKVTLFMKVNKSLMDEGINQLRGSREYDSFISELKEGETVFLTFLAKSAWKATIEEMTLLMVLNDLGSKLQSMEASEIGGIVRDFKKSKSEVQSILDSILTKAQKHGINALTSSLTGMALYDVEDQWIRSYYKYGWRYKDVDLEFGMKPEFNGIRIFGDPTATVIHSALFPGMAEWVVATDQSKAHVGQNDGSHLSPAKGRVWLGVSYQRVADGRIYHLAFQLKDGADVDFWEKEIITLMSSVHHASLVKSFHEFHKFYRS